MAKERMTNKEVKRRNRNDIFRYICGVKTISNPEIAYGLKLSLPTVTQNTKELLEMGVIREVGELDSTGGRRAKALAASADAGYAVGLDITKNHIGLLLANLLGEILDYRREVFPFESSDCYFEKLSEQVELLIENNGIDRGRVSGIGISFPGIVDLEKYKITNSHALDVRELPFPKVEKHFVYPCHFINDANAGALAEGIRMDDQEKFFYLSLSNTVGGALFYQGKLIQGNAFRCGEVGHMTLVPGGAACYCGKNGCMDAYCSAKKLSQLADGKLALFFERLKLKDEAAEKVWDEYTDYLAVAVNNIHMVLDYEIVLGGYVGSYLEEHIEEIREKVGRLNTFGEKGDFVRSCNYKGAAAAFGAAMQVIEQFIDQI